MPHLIDVVKLSEQRCKTLICCDLKYASSDNFVGRLIAGYTEQAKNSCFLLDEVANYLCDVQNYLYSKYHYGLLVYDAYRPYRAVLDFLHWSKQPPAGEYELQQKNKHYPQFEKSQLFDLHYISDNSNHCYGNTVDLVLTNAMDGEVLDMGGCFDFFSKLSHATVTQEEIGERAFQHREILSTAMQRFGFIPHAKEFWHFSHPLISVVDKPIDIPITPGLTKIVI